MKRPTFLASLASSAALGTMRSRAFATPIESQAAWRSRCTAPKPLHRSTACDAADRDYRLVVLGDACADRDSGIQDVLISGVLPQRAQVMTVSQLPELLAQAS